MNGNVSSALRKTRAASSRAFIAVAFPPFFLLFIFSSFKDRTRSLRSAFAAVQTPMPVTQYAIDIVRGQPRSFQGDAAAAAIGARRGLLAHLILDGMDANPGAAAAATAIAARTGFPNQVVLDGAIYERVTPQLYLFTGLHEC